MLTDSTRPLLSDVHVDALALDWQRRPRLLQSPTGDFVTLKQWDDRLAANLKALLLLGSAAADRLRALLKEPLTRGEYFVLARYAFAAQDEELTDTVIALAQSLPHLQQALIAAIEWHGDIRALLPRIDRLPTALRLDALAANAWRLGLNPEGAGPIYAWLRELEPTQIHVEAGLKFVRCIGDDHMAWAAQNHLDHEHPSARLAAAQTLLVLADAEHAEAAIPLLQALAQADASPDMQEAALQCLALNAPDHAAAVLPTVPPRLALKTLGWMGRAGDMAALAEHLDHPELARQAAAAIMLVTGSDPHRDGWAADPPAQPTSPPESETDAIPARDPDAGLPWASRERFTRWWQSHQGRFDPAAAYLTGLPVQPGTLARIIRQGPLAARPLAAERLQHMAHRPLFLTHLPARHQQALFNTLP